MDGSLKFCRGNYYELYILVWNWIHLPFQVLEFQQQQRKCSVIFDLSCNLARVLEFCTSEIPQAFLSGTDTNLRRLTELIIFILNHLTSATDPELFDLCVTIFYSLSFHESFSLLWCINTNLINQIKLALVIVNWMEAKSSLTVR